MHLVPSHWNPLVHTVQRVHQEMANSTVLFYILRTLAFLLRFCILFPIFFILFFTFSPVQSFRWSRNGRGTDETWKCKKIERIEDQRMHDKWMWLSSGWGFAHCEAEVLRDGIVIHFFLCLCIEKINAGSITLIVDEISRYKSSLSSEHLSFYNIT